jgi:hypothetical protein
MARETEIERLIVRLMGDDSSYQAMMGRAADSTGQLTSATEGAKNAVEQVRDPLEDNASNLEAFGAKGIGASRSLKFLGLELTQAGMAITSFDAPLGMTIASLGGMASMAGTAAHGFHALKSVSASLGTVLSKNLMGVAAGGAVVAGIAAIATAYKLAADEAKKVTEETEKIDERLRELYSEGAQRRFKLASQPPLIDPMSGAGESSFASTMARHRQEYKATFDQMAAEQKNAADRFKMFRNDARRASEEAEAAKASTNPLAKIDLPVITQQLTSATKNMEEARKEADKYTESMKDLQHAHKQSVNEMQIAQWQGITDSIRGLVEEHARLTLSEQDASRYAFIEKNALMELPWEQQAMALTLFNTALHQTDADKIAKEVQSLSDSIADMRDRTKEVLNPLDSELRTTNEVSKARRDYQRAHNEGMPKALAMQTEMAANQREHNRLVQEGRQVYEQYMEPLDKMIQSQQKLKQQFAAGGFGEGVKGVKAYEKALAAAYGQAHKDYSAQFLGQQFDAIIGGTNAAARAMHEYTVGMTAIPLEMQTQKKKRFTDEELFGYGKEVKGPVDTPAQLEMAQRLKDMDAGIQVMVGLIRAQAVGRIQFLSANL